MAKPGFPPRYHEGMCETVIEGGKAGKSVAEIALDLGIGVTTLYAYRGKFPEFAHAMEQAMDYRRAWWEKIAREGIISEGGRAVNAALFKCVLASFCEDYRDKREISGPGGGPIEVKTEDLRAKVKDGLDTVAERIASGTAGGET